MRALLFLVLFSLWLSRGAAEDRIERALRLSERTANLVFRDRVEAHWLPDGKSFWYRVQTGQQTHEFVMVDAATGQRKTAADIRSLGLPEPEPFRSSETTIDLRRSRRAGASSSLILRNALETDVELFWINEQGEQVSYGEIAAGATREQHSYEGHIWLIAGDSGEPLAVVEVRAAPQAVVVDGKGIPRAHEGTAEDSAELPRGEKSPDGKWSAFIDQGRVMLQNREAGETVHLETDLDAEVPFRGRVSWAPNSSAFVVSRAADIVQRRVMIVESAPRGQLQPSLKEFVYAKPGDPLPSPVPVLFHIDEQGHDWQELDTELFPNPFTESYRTQVQWAPDSSEFAFDYNERGHQLYRILAADAASGDVRVVVEERAKTFIDYGGKTWRHWLHDTGELLWMSERDGWCHLWLYDAQAGRVKSQVTCGEWLVREVLHVDAENRELWFMASGLNPSEDPYHMHLCRIRFDGSGFVQLTESDGNHRVDFSPGRESFIASWSRVDHPPVHELRRSRDGRLVCVLEAADSEQLLAAGWSMPERFVAAGRDGETEIHGILIKPSHFDPAKRYPVVEEIYAGPHSAQVPKRFDRLLRQHVIAELGFIVVQIDGMGTNHRGKAFHDVCWKNLKDAGFPDRIAWLKAAAQTRPWMDLSRVGIYGGSAGGQNAMRALLDHHDFYRVAVADCGCHDNRMDKIWWNEQWMGWPVGESYARSSNVEDASKLQGELLLLVGELDSNVDPSSTMQVVGALQKAGKAFEFMPIIGSGHGAAETPYGSRLRMEFLVRHLLEGPLERGAEVGDE